MTAELPPDARITPQLPLGLGLMPRYRLANFVPGDNGAAVAAVASCAAGTGPESLLLWGARGSGRTHLLQAACRQAGTAGRGSAYLPLAALEEEPDLEPAALADWECRELLCIDDVERVAGRRRWEDWLFHLFNRARERGTALVFAAAAPPARIGFVLPDLASRLAWGPVFQLRPLDDAGRLLALQRRAGDMGLELPETVGRYLLERCPRDLPRLMGVLETLERASMAAGRRLTVPFVRAVLGI